MHNHIKNNLQLIVANIIVFSYPWWSFWDLFFYILGMSFLSSVSTSNPIAWRHSIFLDFFFLSTWLISWWNLFPCSLYTAPKFSEKESRKCTFKLIRQSKLLKLVNMFFTYSWVVRMFLISKKIGNYVFKNIPSLPLWFCNFSFKNAIIHQLLYIRTKKHALLWFGIWQSGKLIA